MKTMKYFRMFLKCRLRSRELFYLDCYRLLVAQKPVYIDVLTPCQWLSVITSCKCTKRITDWTLCSFRRFGFSMHPPPWTYNFDRSPVPWNVHSMSFIYLAEYRPDSQCRSMQNRYVPGTIIDISKMTVVEGFWEWRPFSIWINFSNGFRNLFCCMKLLAIWRILSWRLREGNCVKNSFH